jgi:hypothetical protein
VTAQQATAATQVSIECCCIASVLRSKEQLCSLYSPDKCCV